MEVLFIISIVTKYEIDQSIAEVFLDLFLRILKKKIIIKYLTRYSESHCVRQHYPMICLLIFRVNISFKNFGNFRNIFGIFTPPAIEGGIFNRRAVISMFYI